HMLNNTIQDVLIRRARMQGYETLWVPGTDHASIATEAKVVAKLKEEGIDKKNIGREEFLKHAWEWKEKYGGIILEQLKKLGASCDWSRTTFTMDKKYYDAVITTFVDLYHKGLIYRGVRMVNWDPKGKTALSDEEVIYKDTKSKLYYVRYKIVDSEEFITIATTRPETILADTAVCVNPKDTRYQHLVGKKVLIPLVNRPVPIIADEYVDASFGTGCLKVTPAHDANDYQLGLKHHLEVIDILDDEGKLNQKAQFYIGKDRFEVRKLIVKDLEALGQLEKVEEITNKVGHSERTDAVVEPKLSTQWFVSMKKLCEPALAAVLNGTIQLYPPKFINTYRHWMENVKDWCISRQLWWGHRIPAYYLPNGEFFVATTVEKALELAKQKTGNHSLTIDDLRQDEDVLDTWFSSWLWPIQVFDGFDGYDPSVGKITDLPKDLQYYYPTDTLVTAPEILFFWVARMIIAGYEYLDKEPFKNVYLTGIVRDKIGRKMSKSLGNSPDPLELIANYGADGVRTGMLFSSPAGNDLLFDEKLCEQGRNFSNKIWNAFRLVKGWKVSEAHSGEDNRPAVEWFAAKFHQTFAEIEEHYRNFRISDALMAIYKLIWDDFCSWYLEMVKPPYGQPIDKPTYDATIVFFENLMKVLHPFMPFITEEIWQNIRPRDEKDYLIVAEYPRLIGYVNIMKINEKYAAFTNDPLLSKIELPADTWQEAFNLKRISKVIEIVLERMQYIFQAINHVRNTRNSKQIPPKEPLSLHLRTDNSQIYKRAETILKKLANISEIVFVKEKVEGAIGAVYKNDEFYIPLSGKLDVEKEREKLLKELEYTKGFLKSVEAKLNNEKFLANAKPELLE
ncbi:MAG: valine--tRNA ligase, partial [Flammeovirgaceae bacterium]|nr:valine--tRNA ligase [Flammeovirgaceae bacterium]MDW8287720.1 valine--tRNA ligase [Flammeovirgaceae bacterium]